MADRASLTTRRSPTTKGKSQHHGGDGIAAGVAGPSIAEPSSRTPGYSVLSDFSWAGNRVSDTTAQKVLGCLEAEFGTAAKRDAEKFQAKSEDCKFPRPPSACSDR